MATFNHHSNFSARLEELLRVETPYVVRAGNDFSQRGDLSPYQVLHDGIVEVSLDMYANETTRDKITLPFVKIGSFKAMSSSGRVFEHPLHKGIRYRSDEQVPDKYALHAIYHPHGDMTHYFLIDKKKESKKKKK